MKLSDIKGERTLDVIADCVEPIANIAADPDASRLFRKEILPEGMDKREFAKERIVKSVPALLKGHKKDLIAILSVLDGVSPKEYTKSLTMGKLMNDCVDLLSDEEFFWLFTSARSGTAGGSFDSARESTAAG